MAESSPMDDAMAKRFDAACDAFIRQVLMDCQQARMDAGNDEDPVMPAIVEALQANTSVPELQMHITLAIAALNKAVTLACDIMIHSGHDVADEYLDRLAGIKGKTQKKREANDEKTTS